MLPSGDWLIILCCHLEIYIILCCHLGIDSQYCAAIWGFISYCTIIWGLIHNIVLPYGGLYHIVLPSGDWFIILCYHLGIYIISWLFLKVERAEMNENCFIQFPINWCGLNQIQFTVHFIIISKICWIFFTDVFLWPVFGYVHGHPWRLNLRYQES